MYSMLSFGAVLVGSLGFVGAISPLSITGSKFFNAAGQQVFFKGSSFPLSVLYSFCLVPSVRYFFCVCLRLLSIVLSLGLVQSLMLLSVVTSFLGY